MRVWAADVPPSPPITFNITCIGPGQEVQAVDASAFMPAWGGFDRSGCPRVGSLEVTVQVDHDFCGAI